jgi:hypothetical protein
MTALTTHSKQMFSQDQPPWNFQQATSAILEHQDICKPANILSLTREAIKYGRVVAFTPAPSAKQQQQRVGESTAAELIGQTNPVTRRVMIGIER